MAEHDYEDGVRDGRIASLETSIKLLTADVSKLKAAIWMLYGAIALVQFLPMLRELVSNGQ